MALLFEAASRLVARRNATAGIDAARIAIAPGAAYAAADPIEADGIADESVDVKRLIESMSVGLPSLTK